MWQQEIKNGHLMFPKVKTGDVEYYHIPNSLRDIKVTVTKQKVFFC
jgi:hypothetical protein